MLEICIIIGVVLGCVVAVVKASGKKKKTKTKETKATKTEQPKKEEAPQKDRSFKIEKNGRLTRVSKNALTTNSRTAQVEKVFAREPETDKSVYISDKSGTETPAQVVETASDIGNTIKNMSTGNAGYLNGDYNGIHLGGRASYSQTTSQSRVREDDRPDNKNKTAGDFAKVEELIAKLKRNSISTGNLLTAEDFGAINKSVNSLDKKQSDIDFDLMVETDAILNPKYKAFASKNKKTST